MVRVFNKKWLKATLVRALRTMTQVAAAKIVVGDAGLFEIEWLSLLSVVLLSGIACLLMSFGGLPEASDG